MRGGKGSGPIVFFPPWDTLNLPLAHTNKKRLKKTCTHTHWKCAQSRGWRPKINGLFGDSRRPHVCLSSASEKREVRTKKVRATRFFMISKARLLQKSELASVLGELNRMTLKCN
eukprot:GEMP01037008.1.p2 GENE.GEMP01037008.1~~GEMP01037008.1.p2  ORF type:complete len:115 (-),score=12.82 GEMP01037008.1:235-579(-)